MNKRIFDFCILSFLIVASASLKLESSSSIKSSNTGNLIINGGFEQPAGDSWAIYENILGWTLRDKKIEVGLGTIYNSNWNTGRVCEIDGAENNKISQSFNLDVDNYFLEFDVAPRTDTSLGTQLMNVYFNDSLVYAFKPIDHSIVHQKISVTTIKGINTVAFQGEGSSDGLGATLDNVLFYKKATC